MKLNERQVQLENELVEIDQKMTAYDDAIGAAILDDNEAELNRLEDELATLVKRREHVVLALKSCAERVRQELAKNQIQDTKKRNQELVGLCEQFHGSIAELSTKTGEIFRVIESLHKTAKTINATSQKSVIRVQALRQLIVNQIATDLDLNNQVLENARVDLGANLSLIFHDLKTQVYLPEEIDLGAA